MSSSTSTILIVDDNPLGREVLADVLESDGYELYYASDGPEALSLAYDLDPDLILLDVMMPDMDGYEVCRRLRSDTKLSEVPVLMISALDDRQARIKGIEVGADDFVSKPVDRLELRARVKTIHRLNRYRKLQEQQKLREKVEDEREELRAQLYRARHMESIGQLAAGLAHDYNNLLTVIMGNAELAMKETTPGDTRRASLREICKAGEHAASLTRKLIVYSQKQIISPEMIDMNSTLQSIQTQLAETLGDRIEVSWYLGRDLGPVKIDPTQLKQVMINICENARDAMQGSGRVTIETRFVNIDEGYQRKNPEAVPGKFNALIVTDTGCGMAPEILSRVFEPYFTTKKLDNNKGTGLGLATVYGIIKQNEGFIEVFSEPHCGTTLKVFIPAHIGAVLGATPETSEQPEDVRTSNVLVVEDNPGILALIAQILKGPTFDVIAASSPAEALAQAESNSRSIDLLITDIMMPEMDGHTLARQLTVRHPELKCLYMSGFSADVISRDGSLENGTHFIAKPFTARELIEKAKSVLSD